MTSISAQNLEDAANIASEFVYSLENLPGEVKFLLEEIKVVDGRVQDLQNQIDTDSAIFIRYNLKASPSNLNIPPSPLSNGNAKLSPEMLPAKIASSYAEMQSLSAEKIHLAEKVVQLIQRTRTRLDIELGKVRVLTGEIVEPPPQPSRAPSVSVPVAPATPTKTTSVAITATATANGVNGNSAAEKISESLKNALMIGGTATALPGEGGRSHKRRRVTTGTSTPTTPAPATTPSINLKLPSRAHSPATPTPAPKKANLANRSSRLSRSIKLGDLDSDADGEDDGDEDAEGDADEDMEGSKASSVNGGGGGTNAVEEEEEDNHLYCFCQRPSYGNMIACDDADCPYEWFHLPCLGLKTSPNLAEWYCPHCSEKQAGMAISMVGRKGRKK